MWFQLTIDDCTQALAEKLSELCENAGAVSVTLTDKFDDAILEPELGTTPLWPHVIVQALFDTEKTATDTQTLLAGIINNDIHIEKIEDKAWERAWMDDFKPVQFGKRLWICPSWSTPPQPEAVNLILDPGLAFGTGTHPTTKLCLEWLEQADLTDKTLIDYGCGSGILALAALKLGAGLVHAVDIDPQALQATQNNALMNQIDAAKLVLHYPEKCKTTTDVLIANILLTPLIALQTTFQTLLKPKGLLVVSGVLAEQTDTLIAAYQPYFSLKQQEVFDGWGLLVFEQ